uniref:Uncharacterized protein n=1 Tax=Anguilla anguilla TaxID=7936 RepID=A0A0E9XWN9_ANGAN
MYYLFKKPNLCCFFHYIYKPIYCSRQYILNLILPPNFGLNFTL